MKADIKKSAGNIYIYLENSNTTLRFSQLHNKVEYWEYNDTIGTSVFVKDFNNVVDVFEFISKGKVK